SKSRLPKQNHPSILPRSRQKRRPQPGHLPQERAPQTPQKNPAVRQDQPLPPPQRAGRVRRPPQNRLRVKRIRRREWLPTEAKRPPRPEAQKPRVLERPPPPGVLHRKRLPPGHQGKFRPGFSLKSGKPQRRRSQCPQRSGRAALLPACRHRPEKVSW